MALKAHRQEKLYLVEPVPKSPPAMVNLSRNFTLAHLANWCVAKKLLSHIRIDLVLFSPLGRHSPKFPASLEWGFALEGRAFHSSKYGRINPSRPRVAIIMRKHSFT